MLNSASYTRRSTWFLPVLALLLLAFPAFSCNSESPVPLVIGIDNSAANSLIIIAREEGFFLDRGLNISLRTYASGLDAVNGMIKGEVDAATASEFVLVGKAFEGRDISAFASIDRIQHIYIFALVENGVEKPSDLAGKRIGLPLDTAAEFYLGSFLSLRGIGLNDVELVDIKPLDSARVLRSGEVDAVVAWQPNALAVQREFGNAVVTWPAQSDRAMNALVIADNDTLHNYPEMAKSFLQALADAEAYCATKEEAARTIAADYLKVSGEDMQAFWPEHVFTLTLDASLVLSLEDAARWMIANGLTGEESVPNFLNYLYLTALTAVKPEAVNIIVAEKTP